MTVQAMLKRPNNAVHRNESVLKSLDARSEEHLDLLVYIEEPEAKQLREFPTYRRLTDTTDTCQEHPQI